MTPPRWYVFANLVLDVCFVLVGVAAVVTIVVAVSGASMWLIWFLIGMSAGAVFGAVVTVAVMGEEGPDT
jgi:hypothetical protein